MQHRIIIEPLTSTAFAPFGDVISIPSAYGRQYYSDALGNLRTDAKPDLSVTTLGATQSLPLDVHSMERHEFSSQTFIPLTASHWLIVVAPHTADGKPDTDKTKAFLGTGKQGITYRPNTWHHSLTVLEQPASFAVFMWRDGGPLDEEFVDVSPFTVIAAP